MANSGAGISSDAAQTSGDEYQVFLSFRGSDTHHGFTDFLYHGLMDAGVRVFKDDDEHLVDEDEHLVGEVISENLFHIMNSATLYIPIFSRTYAFSIRCLQELAFMVDHISKSEDWKSILPIFLDVEPEDVKLRTPLYRAAFEKHKEDFPKEVEAWRNALAAVDEIKGWNVEKDQSRATIVKLVVERVLEKLEINQKSVAERLVGLDDQRKDDVQALKIYRSGDSIEITDEDFERLPNLRLLELNWGTYAGDFARCHSNLRWFSWHSPQDFRANNMYLEHLAVYKLDTIDFKDDSKAWDLIKRAQNLKVLSITQCSGITRIPNFSKCLRLERLTLAECFSLEKIEGFIGDLGSLIELKIEQCQGLRDLPEELGALVKLKRLSLSGCRGLRELPGSFGNLTSLIELNLRGTSIVKSPGMPLLRHAQEIPMDTSNLEFKLDKTEGLEEGPARQTGKESRSWGIRKMVFKLDLHDDKEKKKVLVIVSGFAGVDSFKIDMNDKKLTVFGDIDPVELTLKLRKLFFTEIVSVGPAKEGQKEEDNKKDDNKSNKKEEKADGNTNLEPSHFNIERKRSDDGYNWRKYGQKLVKGSENPRSYYKCTYPGCPTKKKVERSQDGHITEIVYKGTHNHPKSLSPRTLSSQSIEPPSSCITYLENVDQLDSVVRSESVQQDSSASLGDEESKVNSQMCKFAGDDDGIEPEAKRLKGNNVHERYSDSGDRIVREPRVVIQTTSGTDILDDGYYWRKYGQKGVIGRNYYKCRNTGCPARKHVQRASDDMRTLITTYDGKHNHDVLKKDSLPTGHLTWGREPLAPSSIRQGSPDRPNAWSGDPGPDVLSVSVRGISPKMASSEEKKNVIFTE